MDRSARQSGWSLVLAGLAGVLFFWLTDPRWGLQRFGASPDILDAVQEARVGTMVGVAGSAFVLVIGLWLITRRAA